MLKHAAGNHYGIFSKILTCFNNKLNEINVLISERDKLNSLTFLYDLKRKVGNVRKNYNKVKFGYWRDEPKRKEILKNFLKKLEIIHGTYSHNLQISDVVV